MIRKISIFLVAALLLVDYLSPVASAAVALQDVYAQIETTPVAAAGDAADDPAIWVHPTDPSLSLVFGNNKGGKLKEGSLESYDLSGRLLQKISTPSGFYGNVDVRGNYVVVAKGGIRVYQINPDTRKLSLATDGSGTITTAGEGLCLYDPGVAGVTDGLYAFTITRSIGRVRQYQLLDADRDGLLTGSLVRDFTIGTEAEGCVADDVTGNLFISEEDVALWRYGADASSGTTRTLIDAVDEDTPGDLEGVAIAGNHLFVSVQNVA
ncbi:MAG TPA: phytase, partial [Candidatus Nitrosotenuis sp.]|nr:phytase [Candidatus Nitrosotenuis sp.]